MSPLLLKLVFSRVPNGAPFGMRTLVALIARRAQDTFVDPQLNRHIDYWEAELGRSGWFASNDFTAADIMMSFPLEAAAARAHAASRPRIADFLELIHARPGYVRALQRGGTYEYARG